ncbi:hypothetical protein GO605_22940 [Streptomyces murinus]|nr:hypothetical protein GO605_22940 [Streptomyces murinus]
MSAPWPRRSCTGSPPSPTTCVPGVSPGRGRNWPPSPDPAPADRSRTTPVSFERASLPSRADGRRGERESDAAGAPRDLRTGAAQGAEPSVSDRPAERDAARRRAGPIRPPGHRVSAARLGPRAGPLRRRRPRRRRDPPVRTVRRRHPRRPLRPTLPAKFALGMFAMGGSMLLMSLAAWHAHSVGRVSPLWLVGTYLLMGAAEAALAPVGMSVATAIAPASFLSQVVGVFWLSAALGAGFGGNAMKFAGSSAPGAGLFLVLGAAAVGAGSVLLLSARGLARRLGV